MYEVCKKKNNLKQSNEQNVFYVKMIVIDSNILVL